MKFDKHQKSLFDQLSRQQKLFVEERLKDRAAPNTDIYRRAMGTNDKSYAIAGMAHRMAHDPIVKALLETIEIRYMDDAIMKREEMLIRLTKIARADVGDVVTVLNDGQQLIDATSGELIEMGSDMVKIRPDADLGLLSEVRNTKDGVAVKVRSAEDAMKQIAAMQGFNAPTRTEITGAEGGPVTTKEMTDDEFVKHLENLGL